MSIYLRRKLKVKKKMNVDNINICNKHNENILIQCKEFIIVYEILLNVSATCRKAQEPLQIFLLRYGALYNNHNNNNNNNNNNKNNNNKSSTTSSTTNNNNSNNTISLINDDDDESCSKEDDDTDDDEFFFVGFPKQIVQSFDTIVSLFLQNNNSLLMKSLSDTETEVVPSNNETPTPTQTQTQQQQQQQQQQQDSSTLTIESLRILQRYVTVIQRLCQHDIVFAEELAKQGIHKLFIQLLRIENKYNDDDNGNDKNDHCKNNNNDNNINNEYDNSIECIKDTISDIISITTSLCNISFPCSGNPYTINELRLRLPLCFSLLQKHKEQEQEQEQEQIENQQQEEEQEIVHLPIYSSRTYTTHYPNYYKNNINDTILINQVLTRQSAQEDVGFVVWPAAVILSRWIEQNLQQIVHHATILAENNVTTTTTITSSSSSSSSLSLGLTNSVSNSSVVSSSSSSIRILELGCGCGLSGLTIGKLLQKQRQQQQQPLQLTYQVILSDFNSIVVKNVQQNILLNTLQDTCSTIGLDFNYYYHSSNSNSNSANDNVSDNVAKPLDLDSVETNKNKSSSTTTSTTVTHNNWYDMDSKEHIPVHIVIGADIICQESDSYACVATLETILYPNGYAYIVCGSSHHRYGINVFANAINASNVLVLVKTISIKLINGTIIVSSNDDANSDDNDDSRNCTDCFNFDCFQQEQIQSEIGQTAGYVNGMELLFFIIRKKNGIQ